jgi:rhodanese-related sulfurtransferase
MRPTALAVAFETAAAAIDRLTPEIAASAMESDALLIDIRSFDARARDGVVPGSLHIPRTVLEWRLERGGAWRSPYVRDEDRVLLVCDHGYSSVFAAVALVQLGWNAGDVLGGLESWRDRGLPWQVAVDRPLGPGELPGMRPPEPSRP